ncbi:polyphosphate kinase 1 [Miltoncostaea marina]|uniref:polyphosphate kinase 1 n=1 Tax=Miltoncostaea marina TaxID=2843215 RepID=UPI001C3E65FB|nr:polyphosphate kinase 1 [Miltoncostaea marina]
MTTAETPSTRASPTAAPDLADPRLYINRELSWLEFNARVLALAREPGVPLLERCKFLAIFSSNLDEFFMVRVATVQDAMAAGRRSSTPDKLPRDQVLDRVATRVRELTAEQSRIWTDELLPALAAEGIAIVPMAELTAEERAEVVHRFDREVYPVLTPLAVGPGLPFPYISGLSLNIGLQVRDPVNGETRFARIKVPPRLPRFLQAGERLVLMEEVIEAHLERLFPGMEIVRSTRFRVTRDADFSISDESDDLLGAVEAQLRRRRFGHVVRLEVEEGTPDDVVAGLMEALEVEARETFRVRRPLDLTSLMEIASLDRPALRDTPWEPRTMARLRGEEGDPIDLFATIRAGDVLVHHPYDDFHTSVERFLEQAVEDPNVLAVKQTVYRTSGDSPIVPALMRTAEQGKQTVCLVEVQARFDEERNIQWARALERAGAHVVYGLSGLKTHAKLCLVVRREGDRVRRYVHIGTGNYNPSTADLYTDLGLFTCREDIAEDVADLFNHLTGFARPPSYRRALVAPAHLREGVIAEIERVVAAHSPESPSRVVMKMNSIIDGPVIEAIYRASQAGVRVELIVRGITGLRTGVPGVSENVRAISIVGRFLEHARIFAFTAGGETTFWIGSADMMARNLDNRVELVTPVDDPAARAELQAVLDLQLADTALAWELGPDGGWRRVRPAAGEAPLNSQEALMRYASTQARSA